LCLGVNQYGIEQFWAAIVLFALSSYVFVPVGILAMGRGRSAAAEPAVVAMAESA